MVLIWCERFSTMLSFWDNKVGDSDHGVFTFLGNLLFWWAFYAIVWFCINVLIVRIVTGVPIVTQHEPVRGNGPLFVHF